ncbi:hypothetical protein ES288_A12G102400v1 [Gossypium darwinii]|uniref:NAB domain-containing protein n=1 Tax=Gossypium darwinii TaxID=34276 RepID=A0A5D2E896_GOSDA|nr:hypothetical protein ES288_A12G102400v1 [Gossypium darwinii]
MLQRAANNAYSWWWASHIRTKQSKWMDQNLQDMEQQVKAVLKLLDEEGDSFARRAEMYYKRRPELIHFVEESYRAYRALAERYDHLSTELQNANSTIASVFPEQLHFAMEDEDEFGSPKFSKKPLENSKGYSYVPYVPEYSKAHPYLTDNSNGHSYLPYVPHNATGNIASVPNVPNPLFKDAKGSVTSGFKKKQQKIISQKGSISVIPKSGLSIPQGLDAIHRLQKRILALQTEKEFAHSTYESGMAKYWELDNEIQEIHKQLCGLEDEFGEGKAIADDEARILMEVTALKSCRDTLAQLEEKQERSAMEAQIEHKRVKVSREKLNALKKKFHLLNEVNQEKGASDNDDNQKRKEIESLKGKIKKQFEVFFSGTLSVTEMAEKIDELVNNVINLKSTVTSQSILVQRLRIEIDELQGQIEVLEDEKATSIDGKNDVKLKKIREMEGKLNEIQDLSQTVEDKNNNLQIYFTEANCSIDHISEKFDRMMPLPDDKVDEVEKSSSMEVKSSNEKETKTGIELETTTTTTTGTVMVSTSLQGKDTEAAKEHESDATCTNGGVISHETSMASEKCEDSTARASSLTVNTIAKVGIEGDEPNSKQLLSKGIEDKAKDILMEYSLKLRNLNKDTEKKLKEAEANNQNGMFDIMSQLKELKESNAMKDELIRSLQEKLSQTGVGEASSVISEKIVVIETQPAESRVNGGFDVIDAVMQIAKSGTTSEIEDKFRADIDELLEENLDFWYRFSTTFQEVNKFEEQVKDLSAEVLEIEERRKESGDNNENSVKYAPQSDARPLYKHLREVQKELRVWMEKGVMLKEELKERFSSLCEIQEEITRALKASAEDDEFKFTSDQAAKFQGEILNMKQENVRVAIEVQAGLNNVTKLQLEVERNHARLSEKWGISGSKNRQSGQLQCSERRSRVPLSAFLFGGKPKKQRTSILRRMNNGLMRSVNSSKY